ncbi:flippase-like domain-containing protein [Oculatella sp. LEGE 06141]|uniref:lysylphosphatidylglycerol synthase domain-containing protein n=1 Tax=Oculatella sp. LEGE 06141 TaxID=1828648 RepID=UPI001880C097|nr:lysylphosphatidylglycerol synthase domain-containing protein [Oculatella sp. LEGE 06141]MBE9177360.1 flippase-like domain-containing protein [Oculatella sp. LEGE 06141]
MTLKLRPLIAAGNQVVKRFKPYLRWFILGGTLLFLVKALKDNWREVTAIRIDENGWACLAIATGVTLLAHIWSGWVWSWILRELNQPANGVWGVLVYLKTNIAKYLPGNVWHFYGRVNAARAVGFPLGAATLSVLMEPLLMAASALMIALATTQQVNLGIQVFSLVAVLLGIHPWVLNPILRYLSRVKAKMQGATDGQQLQIKRYPLLPLLGELGFLGLRGSGFLLTIVALQPVQLAQTPSIISAFGIAWLVGLVVPGAPGGLGVFEATAIALLNHEFSTGSVLSAVALYRLVSTLAEAIGASMAWLDDQWNMSPVESNLEGSSEAKP